jgi:predicted nucleic acid-binding protein
MRYWDTSALIPLTIREPRSEEMRLLASADPLIVTSVYTIVEVASAHWRRRHTGELTMAAHETAERNFAELSETWIEVPVSQGVLDAAISVLSRHNLRAGDALQLGAAHIASGQQPSLAFVTLDENLKAAARAEGFPVLP